MLFRQVPQAPQVSKGCSIIAFSMGFLSNPFTNIVSSIILRTASQSTRSILSTSAPQPSTTPLGAGISSVPGKKFLTFLTVWATGSRLARRGATRGKRVSCIFVSDNVRKWVNFYFFYRAWKFIMHPSDLTSYLPNITLTLFFLFSCLIASQSSVVIGTSSPAFPQNTNNTAVNGTGKFLTQWRDFMRLLFLSLNMQTVKPRPKITIQLLQLKLFILLNCKTKRSWISRGIF